MILQEFKRCWKSKINIIMMVVMLLGLLPAYFSSLADRNVQLRNVEAALAVGADPVDSLWQYEAMHGALYFWEVLFTLHGPFIFFTLIMFTIGAGIFISGKLFSELQTGYGMNILTRTSYKRYLKNTIIAQFLYVVSFLLLFFSLVLISLSIIEGGPWQISRLTSLAWDGAISLGNHSLIHFGFVLHIVLSMAFLILLASLSCVYLKNKYIIQFLPVSFLVGAYIFAGIFGDLNTRFESLNQGLHFISNLLIFEASLGSLVRFFSVTSGGGSVTFAILYPLLLLTISLLLYKLSLKKFGKDYI